MRLGVLAEEETDCRVIGILARRLPRAGRLGIIRLSRLASGKPLYSQNDNPKWAEKLDLELCAQRCPAFRQLRDFVLEVVA